MHKRTLFLFDDAPQDGNGAPPPTAEIVQGSQTKPEDAAELVKLRQEKADLEAKLKARETEIAHVQDENHRLKAPPAPAPKREERRPGWMDMYRAPESDASDA